ncbi:MAG: mercuric reductase [Verrucomicrobiales bacterium]|nr:mercuric reductase [Verrucomicrobiales bacterium]
MNASTPPLAEPWDSHNQRLVAHVHPPDWKNPTPAARYNLVVIGAGTAGLVTAAAAAGLGAKVALIEKHLMGGDCLNVGCVPSKALVRAARAIVDVRQAGQFGVHVPAGVKVDFGEIMERMRRLRAEISPHDSAKRFSELGVDVFLGTGCFVDPETIRIGTDNLRFHRAVIATGARAAIPAIPGLEEVGFLTNETLFSLTELPKRLAIIGAGPIGCEMAQCFARFGSQVFLLGSPEGILIREDRDAARIVQNALVRDGVTMLSSGRSLRVSRTKSGIQLTFGKQSQDPDLEVDRLLVAVGRTPNLEGLGLNQVGVESTAQGVVVDDFLRTTNRRIYACGDICSPFQFTHAADFMARIVVQNALFKGRSRASSLVIPRATYTSPELAHVGLSPQSAEALGIRIDTFTQELGKVDRAILDEETEGFVRVHVRRGGDHIVGATVVAAHAGDLIGELVVAMRGGIGLKTLASAIHPYPTQAEAIRKTGDLYNRTRLTPFLKALFKRWLAWQR